jgi:hypothetical protein
MEPSDKEEYNDLYENFIKLENKHNELITEHSNLVEEFRENVIIQSMQDMKERYERMLRTTVPKIKYDILTDKYLKILKIFSGCTVLLDHTTGLLHKAENVYSTEFKNYLKKIQIDVSLVKEILEDSITNYNNN